MSIASQRIVTALLLVAMAACAPGPPAGNVDGTWMGTITSEGNVTTVLNESGSVWGGKAILVEEASIGVESGADEYMFGWISGVYATETRIYVLDRQAETLRVYDYSGRHLRDFGRPGQGPGEISRPCFVAGTPDGSIFLTDSGNARINVYSPDGSPRSPWPLSWMECHRPMVATEDGIIWAQTFLRDRGFSEAMLAHGPEGFIGEPLVVPDLDYERWTLRARGRLMEVVPFSPKIVWGMSPVGAMVVGASDHYRFELRYPGGTSTVIERYWDPAPVIEAEREYWSRYLPWTYASAEPGRTSTFDWDGRLPSTKPAFEQFLPTYSDQVWVLKESVGEPLPDCEPSEAAETPSGEPVPCFEQTWTFDVFAVDGKYLGEVAAPDRSYLGYFNTFVRGDTVIASGEDDAGTIMVKRYRLVLPDGVGSRS